MIDPIELRNRAGSGIAVIVEGKDARYYSDWFSSERHIAFVGNGGWREVSREVQRLRPLLNGRVYGILDRDFTTSNLLDADFTTLGLLRTHRYTIENYLLEADIWFGILRDIFRWDGGLPTHWDSAEKVQSQIINTYRTVLPVAAYNFAANKQALTHDYASRPEEVHPKLRARHNNTTFLHDYETRLEWLTSADFTAWQETVSGKSVLRLFHKSLPKRPKRGSFDLDYYLNVYLQRTFDQPPVDLSQLINRLVATL